MGALFSFINQSFPPKAKWGPDNMPDLNGKVVLVTGGNAGVGKETVKALLNHNGKVYMAARNAGTANEAIQELKKETGKEAIFLQLDLADLPSVRKAAEEFNSKERVLHVLINNAGVMANPMDQLTKQGYDMQIGTNVLGHAYFTKLLLPALLAASEEGSKARVVTVSSSAAYFTPTFHFEYTTDTPQRQKKATSDMYFDSKLGNAIFSKELARRHGDKIVSIATNPGNLKTDLQKHVPDSQRKMMNWIMYPPAMGAINQLYAGTAPEAADLNGKFLIPWARVGKPPASVEDQALGEKLWTWVDEQASKY